MKFGYGTSKGRTNGSVMGIMLMCRSMGISDGGIKRTCSVTGVPQGLNMTIFLGLCLKIWILISLSNFFPEREQVRSPRACLMHLSLRLAVTEIPLRPFSIDLSSISNVKTFLMVLPWHVVW